MSKISPEESINKLINRRRFHNPHRVYRAIELITGPVGDRSAGYDVASGFLLMTIGAERVARALLERSVKPIETGGGRLREIIRREIVNKPHSHPGLKTLARDLRAIVGSGTE